MDLGLFPKLFFLALLDFLIFEVSATSNSLADCPLGLKRDKYLQTVGDSCFRFELTNKATFSDAHSECQKEGGSLALVKSKETNEFIQKQLTTTYNSTKNPVWIGVRFYIAKNFLAPIWMDSDNVTFENFHKTYYTERKECAAMNPTTGLWDLFKCKGSSNVMDEVNHYVCQYPLEKFSKCPANLTRDRYLRVFGEDCFRFEVNPKEDFYHAENYCKDFGGDLVTIKDEETERFIHSALNRLNATSPKNVSLDEFWIGLHYTTQKGRFGWVDGDSMKYTGLKTNQFFHAIDPCVALSLKNKNNWVVEECKGDQKHFIDERKNSFICQIPFIKANSTNSSTTLSSNPSTTLTTVASTTPGPPTTLTNLVSLSNSTSNTNTIVSSTLDISSSTASLTTSRVSAPINGSSTTEILATNSSSTTTPQPTQPSVTTFLPINNTNYVNTTTLAPPDTTNVSYVNATTPQPTLNPTSDITNTSFVNYTTPISNPTSGTKNTSYVNTTTPISNSTSGPKNTSVVSSTTQTTTYPPIHNTTNSNYANTTITKDLSNTTNAARNQSTKTEPTFTNSTAFETSTLPNRNATANPQNSNSNTTQTSNVTNTAHPTKESTISNENTTDSSTPTLLKLITPTEASNTTLHVIHITSKKPCDFFYCNLTCGLRGLAKDPVTGCTICQCT